MAGMAMLSWQVFGRGGHASRPDMAINPIFAATNILNTVAIAWNSQRDITKLVNSESRSFMEAKHGMSSPTLPTSAEPSVSSIGKLVYAR